MKSNMRRFSILLTDEVVQALERLKAIRHATTDCQVIREAILEYTSFLETSTVKTVIPPPAPSPGPAVGSVVHGRVWTDREARALEEMRRNPEAFPPPKHPYVENPYK